MLEIIIIVFIYNKVYLIFSLTTWADKMDKKIIVFFGFGLLIMAVMLYFIGIDEVIADLKMSDLRFVLLAVALQIFAYFLYTLRWSIINKTADMDLGIKKLLPMVMVSLAVNNITPSGRGGGEPVRAYLLAKEGHYKFEDTFATVIADRALDTFPFVILSIITIVGIILTFSLDMAWIVFLIICVTAITALVILLIYVCVNESFGVKLTGWISAIVRKFYKKYDDDMEKRIVEAVSTFQSRMNALIRDRDIILYALPLSFIIWIFEILRVYAVFLAFGADVSPFVIGEVFIIASLVGMIPLLPGGLGAIDGVMILLYSNAGILPSVSAAATVVERLISFWMTTFFGLIALSFYGTSVLDKSFSLAESEGSDNEKISEEERKALEQSSEEDSSADDIQNLESDNEEEPILEVIEDDVDKEKPLLEVIEDDSDKEEELLEEVKN